MIRPVLAAAAAVLAFTALPAQAADAALKAAIAGPQRAPENVARDGARPPGETLTVWGVKPTLTILEPGP